MSEISGRLAGLSPERRLLLQMLLEEERRNETADPVRPGGETSGAGALPQVPRSQPFSLISEEDRARLPDGLEDAYPLAMAQLGMIYHMQLTPDASTPSYHNVNSFQVRMELAPEAFRQAVEAVVARHPQLRTSFDLTSYSEPLQLVHRSAELPVIVEDLRHLDPEEQQRAIDEFIRRENTRLVDLSRPPLLRFFMHRRTDETLQFTLTEPHSISDGWSITSTLTDIFQHYVALLNGETPEEPPPLATSYREFVRLEREALQSEEHRRFWKSKLAGGISTPLPRWPAAQLGEPARLGGKPTIDLTPALEGLQRLVRSAGAPLKTVLLAAHLKVMGILAGQDEVVTGLTVHGRPESADGERIRGLFLNTLPFRLRMPAGTWIDLVRTTFATEVEMLPYRRYPLAAAQRLAGGRVFFESAFSFLHFHSVRSMVRSGRIEFLERGNSDLSVTHFPLAATFLLSPEGSFLQLTLEHNDSTLARQQIRWILEYYRSVVHAMAQEPESHPCWQSFLSDAERMQALGQEPVAASPLREGVGLHSLFALQAALRPGEPALVLGDRRLSYGELDQRAYALAGRLRDLGVGRGDRVGLCLDRSLEMVVAILGVLKAGGAYVPLDPAYPEARLSFILRDAGANVLVTQEHLAERLQGERRALVLLDGPEVPAGDGAPLAEDPGATPDDPAYVIYTSGSTGEPKGVVVTHGNVIRLFAATHSWFEFDERDVWTLFHSYAFDFSVWEIWGALLFGGRLVVVPQIVSRSPGTFYELLRQERVTVLNQTPSIFRQLIQAEEDVPEGDRELALRLVIFGGEALSFQSLRPWFERHGDKKPRLINMYGITETTVHVTYRHVTAADLETAEGSLLGQAIPDLGVYVLDAHLLPVPVGVTGELCVSGAGLAQGYLQRPELTALRFVPNPFARQPGERLYRSGDLGRVLPDGDVEYQGRLDHQVKVRGFRIELGEIEAALARHPKVRETVVLAREDMPGDRRLVAYVVQSPGEAPRGSELREHLKGLLPEHEIPAAFVLLDHLPVTAHGKIDRAALPAPDSSRPDLEQTYVAPRNRIEEILARVWCQALVLEQVGVHDSFLALGGDSIRSIRVIAMAREHGLDVSLQQLLQFQTIAELAQRVREIAPAEAPEVRGGPFRLLSPDDRRKLPADLEDAYPLTMLQAGMLYHMALDPDSPVYHNVNSFYLRAPFGSAEFEEAVDQVIARHPVLRTSFDFTTCNEPLQLVHRTASAPPRIEDIRHLTHQEQEDLVDELIRSEERLRFDLSRAPQVRFHVYRRADDTFQLTVTENHAILDGWSLHAMLAEIFETYKAMLDGTASRIPPPPTPSLSDFVELERAALESKEAERYWEPVLRDLTLTEIPTEPGTLVRRPGPRVRNLQVWVPLEVSHGLRDLARAAAVPIKSVLLAAHLKAMSRITGRSEILTGFATHGRPEESGGERVLGFFLNTLPLRLELAGPTWKDLVQQAFAAEQELIPFRRYPLIALQRRCGGRQLFDSLFNFVQFHVVREMIESGDVESLQFKKISETNFRLATGFQLDAVNSRVQLELNCDSMALSEPQIQRIGTLYGAVLRALAFRVDEPHETDPLLTPSERQQLVFEWNDTDAAYPQDRSLPALFAEQVEHSPEEIALVCGDERLSFRALDERSNRLAHHLRHLGVGPENLVALCLERSADLVVGLLGILKTGAAYVPLDPESPPERLAWILSDTGARVLVTEGRLAGLLPDPAVRRVLLDGDRALIVQRGAGPLSGLADPEGLAYVMYTSGSTGRPKGVAVPQRAVARLVRGSSFATFGPGEVFLQLAPVSFDASTFEIWGSLLNGARLVVFPPRKATLEELGGEIVRHGVTTLWLTAGLFHLMMDERSRDLAPVRQMLAGGDVLSPVHARKFLAAAVSGARLINGYGPTEGATFTCCNPVGDPAAIGSSFPVGRPIANTQVYLLDGAMTPVPLAVPGEIFIGGHGLARGYWNRPDLTAERFVPDPVSGQPGVRLYRSGDLARWLPDGTVDFLGRIDQQVKIRGFRVELGEIEAALAEHPEVERAAVIARPGSAADRALVAYVVARSRVAPTESELRDFLRRRLPNYMVPALFTMLSELPLNANGKVDRRALPEPVDAAAGEEGFAAPRTPTEEILAGLWEAVLHRERAGLHDDFFALGGHSLLATQLISRVRQTFGVALDLASLFEAPTVASLAVRIDALAYAGGQVQAAIEPAPREGLLPLSFAQERLWFLDQLTPESPAYNIPTVLRLAGTLDVPCLARTLDEIVRRHEVLRTTFGEANGRPVQVVHPPAHRGIPLIDLSGLPEPARQAAAGRLSSEEGQRPFDLRHGPLLRTALIFLGRQEHLALFTMHHIVSDGWSMRVLVEEMRTLYEAYGHGPGSPLPELRLQYADFALWQRRLLQGEALDAELAWWRRQLGGRLPSLELPTDRPRPDIPSSRGASRSFMLPRPLADRIRELGRAEGATLFMVLLGAFQALLRIATSCDDLVLGTDTANRDHPDTEGIIGFFVNQIVLRTDLSGDPSFRELLGRVRRVVLETYEHRHLPFDKIVEAVNPSRRLDRAPLFQIKIAFNNVPMPDLALSGVAFSTVEFNLKVVQLDMILNLVASDQVLGGNLEYSTDLFDSRTIERMLEQFRTILDVATVQPEVRLSALAATLGERERQEQVVRSAQADEATLRRLKSSRRTAQVIPNPLDN